MRIVVLGAGVVGITTAWFLRQSGHEVTVIDRQSGPAQETSYANGGQISVSHAQPWANPSAPFKVLKWLAKEDAPFLFRLRMDPAQWWWGLHFLMECTSARARNNIFQMINLGTYSRSVLQALRAEIGIEYDHLERGILHFYTNPDEFEAAREPARIMREFGCQREMIDAHKAVELEPALRHMERRIVGATYTREDESGDARKFTRALADACENNGVKFRYGVTITGLEQTLGKVSSVRIIDGGQHQSLEADAYVLCLGSFSALLARSAGIRLNIYPAKGYSVTVPVDQPEDAYQVSLIDDEFKLVYSRLGDYLRIAGTAELNGYSLQLNERRCQMIVERASELFPGGGHWNEAQFWTGLRPATPSNVPYVGRSRLPNLYLNTGHGTLGWTHSCGSAKALADIIDDRHPEVDFAFTGVERPKIFRSVGRV